MGGFESLTVPPAVALATTGVGPPMALYVGRDDFLVVRLKSRESAINVDAQARILLPNGEIQLLTRRFLTTTAAALIDNIYKLPECWLLSVLVHNPGSGGLRGHTYAQVVLTRGDPTVSRLIGAVLCKGYVSNQDVVSWPGAQSYEDTEGRGNYRTITGSDPAAGLEISETVPTGVVWRLISMRATLVTAVGGADRQVHLLLDNGVSVYNTQSSPSTQAAAVTRTYTFTSSGVAQVAAGSNIQAPLPLDWRAPEAHRIRTVTENLAVGDNWGAPILLVEEWLHGQ